MERAQVEAGGGLVDAESELRHHGVEVVEDIGLQVLVGLPVGAGGEEVQLEGYALRRGLKLPRHVEHGGVVVDDLRIVRHKVLHVVAQQREVDHRLRHLVFDALKQTG